MEYDPIALTRLLVFGASSPSSDYNEHIRSANAGLPGISYNMLAYMTTGAGRYAFPSLFGAVTQFFEHTTISDGTYTWTQLATELGLSSEQAANALKINVSNYSTDGESADFALRCYLFGNSGFALNADTMVFKVQNGVRTIENMEVRAAVDNFDNQSEGKSVTQVANDLVLKPAFDPYNLTGDRPVMIYYAGDGKKYTQFSQSDYAASASADDIVRTATNLVDFGFGVARNAAAFAELFNTIGQDSFLGYVKDGRSVIYGSAGADNLGPSSFRRSLNNPLAQDSFMLVGGAGNDTITGGGYNDKLLGGDGADSLDGSFGSDELIGGGGNDTLDGGLANDRLEGGTGSDRYVFSGTYGSDTIKDSDGQGSVVISGTTMTGGKREEGKSYYEDKATNTYYYWSGNTLSIRRPGSPGQVTVQDWSNGQLGIRLVEDIPKPRPVVDPIVLDLDSDGIETVGLTGKVHFDHANDGFAELTGWVGADDGMLVRDLDGDGKITSGKELFGSETLLSGGSKAANGFAALAELDLNNDKVITADEATALKVWRDLNQNGLTDAGELQSLADAGVRSIKTTYTTSSITDSNGNQHRQVGSYVAVDGSTRSAVDVWLVGDPSDSIAIDDGTVISPSIAALPNIEGYGKLPSLHQSMAKDPALQALVTQFAQAGASDRATLMRDILWRWTGADTKTANSRGVYIADARWLYMVEAFTGSPFTQVGGINSGTANPGPVGAADINAISKHLYELLYSRLGAQTYLKNVQDAVLVTWDDAHSTFVTDISNATTILRAGIVANRAPGLAVLSDFVRSLRTLGQFTTETQNSLLNGLSDLGLDVTQAIQSPVATGFGLDVIASNGQTILGTPQSDTLVGTSGNDVLSGDASNDSLIGGLGNDVLDGGLGADKLFGNEGADTYLFGRNSGQDTIDNFDQNPLGTNADQILFSTGVKSQDVSLTRAGDNLILTINNTTDSLTVLNFYAFAERDFFFNGSSQIESVRFADSGSAIQIWTAEDIRRMAQMVSPGNDRLTGSGSGDIIDMQGGDDTVYGLGGTDSIKGGSGADQLYGGSGQDTLDGGTGNDFLDGGAGDDTYWFGLGDGNDILREGTASGPSDSGGTDTLRIRSGVLPGSVKISRDRTDIVLTLPGRTENQVYITDSIRLQNVLDYDGANTFSVENVVFDNGETWTIDNIKSRLLAGGDTNDVIVGYATSDALHGNGGDDTLIGNGGADNLFGDAGKDKLYGGEGDDYLDGGQDSDALYGNAGNDTLDGGIDNDLIDGGLGSDTYLFGRNDGQDTVASVYDSTPNKFDILQFKAGISPSDLALENFDVRDPYSGSWRQHLMIRIKDTLDQIVVNDFMKDYDPANKFNPLQQIKFTNGPTWQLNDILNYMYAGSNEADDLTGTINSEIIKGGIANDTIHGIGGNDTLEGNEGDDELTGSAGNDSIDGGAGNDYLIGYAGSDTYFFGRNDGQDTIDSGVLSWDPLPNGVDTLEFKSDITRDEIVLSFTDEGSLVVKVRNTSAQIEIVDFSDTEDFYSINQFKFSDGIIWDLTKILEQLRIATEGADGLRGSKNSNIIDGLGGNDFINGGAGNDTLYGGLGNDVLYGGDGADSLIGGAGDDVLFGGAGLVNLNPETDNSNDTLDGGSGNDTVSSYGGDIDTILFGRLDGQDQISGSDSILKFKSGIQPTDIYFSRSGESLFVHIKDSTATIDALSFFSPNKPFGDDGYTYNFNQIAFTDSSTIWQLADIKKEFYSGTDYADVLTGDSDANLITTKGGNDTIWGMEGNDTLDGGADNDTLRGGDGRDLLFGGVGNDRLNGDDGTDTLEGGLGNDTLESWLGDDVYLYDKGDGQDYISDSYDEQPDKLKTLQFKSKITASEIRLARSGEELVATFATAPTDKVRVGSFFYENNPVNVLNPLQRIAFADGSFWDLGTIQTFMAATTASGSGTLTGTAAANKLYAATSNDTLLGQGGADFMFAGAGNDSLDGGTENDMLYGEVGADTLIGGLGNDTLNGGDGDDSMTGGDGDDTYIVTQYFDEDYVLHRDKVIESNLATSGVDTVITTSEGYALATNVENLVALGGGVSNGNNLANRITGSEAIDYLYGRDGNDTILGGGGHDTLYGDEGDDVLDGSDGNDGLYGGLGTDTLTGGDGDDTYYVTNYWDDEGALHRDKVIESDSENSGIDTVFTYDNDYGLAANVENLTVLAGILAHGNNLANRITGSAEADFLDSRDGNDTIVSGAGNDIIWGGEGDDSMDGGVGNDFLDDASQWSRDVYIWGRNMGSDVLTDAGGVDRLDVLAGVTADQLWLRHVGNNLELSVIGTSDKFTINNWYTAAANQVESVKLADGKTLIASKVENLVQAMANGLTPPAIGQTTLPANYQTALNPVIAASWA